MRYARIQNNECVEIGDFPFDPNGILFHPSLLWVQSDIAQEGMDYIAGEFSFVTSLAAKSKLDAETIGLENYKALIRREADALDAAGEPYKAIKHLKLIGE